MLTFLILIFLMVMGSLSIIVILIDKYIIPKLNPDNRFVKWWKKHIIDEDPDHL
jgi:hypothetical protein